MSVLETIRKRAKLLVIIIGASLVIFILEDALTSGRFFFGGGDNTVAVINGKKIDYTKFRVDADNAVEKEKASMGVESLNDSDQNVAVQKTLKNMVFKMILGPEYQKLGINVSDSELTDLMLGSHPAPDVYRLFSDGKGKIMKQFQDPRTGGLNMGMVIRYVKQMNEQDQARWELLEDKIRNEDIEAKYFYLLINGLFIPDAIAKQDYQDRTKAYNITYVLKRYTDIPDNSVTVSEQDITDYYNKHVYAYYQQQESRKVDYVTFSVNPTDSDMANIKMDVDTMYSQFKRLKPSEDSAFIVATDAQMFDYQYHKESELPALIDSVMTHSEVGTVYGPYKEDGKYKIAKLLDVADLADSVRYSQIFIPAPNGDFDKIRPFVDSIKAAVTVDNFADYAKANSKDPETTDKGGDVGWVNRGAGLPPALERQMFFGKIGNIIELKLQQGFLIICVTDEGVKTKSYKVGIATKNIEPSTTTQQKVYAEVSEFEGKNHTSDAFEKAAAQMNRRVITINENATTVAGLQSAKELVRWTYDKKEGDISDAINTGENKYIVAHLMQVTKMGTMPLEQVKEEVKNKVIREKKAEKIITDMKSALSGGGALTLVAQKMASTPAIAEGLTFESPGIPSLGKEDAVIGTMSAMNTGTISQPIQGELGVYVIKIDSVYSASVSDYRLDRMRELEALRNDVPGEAYNALLKKAGFVSHIGKYY